MPSDISVTINPQNSTSVTIGGALYPHANTHFPNGSDPITGFASYEQLISVSGLIGSPPDVVLLVGDQNISGVKNFYSRPTISGIPVLISGEAGGAANTGELVNVFYPLNSNPSGYVTGQIVRPSETGAFLVTGAGDNRYVLQSLSGQFASVSYVLNVSGDLQNQLNTLIGETGNYVLASQTGGFLSTGAADVRYALQNKTGEYAETFYPKYSNPSGYITGVDLSNYSTIPYVTGLSGYLDSQISSLESVTGSFALAANTGGFLTTGAADSRYQSGYWITGYNDSITGISVDGTSSKTITLYQRDGSTLSASFSDIEGTGVGTDYFLTGASFNSSNGNLSLYVNDGSVVIESLDGRYVTGNVVRPSETGSFVVAGQTGLFYPTSNPSGFITGVNLSNYATISYVTGASGHLQSQISAIQNGTGLFITGVDLSNYVTKSSTGDFITSGQTGQFVSSSATGNFVTGSVVRPSETGAFLTSSSLSPYQTIAASTGISGYLQGQISAISNNSGSFLTTGAGDLRYYPLASNPSSYLVAADVATFTGQAFSGYSNSITGLSFAGSDTKTLTLYQQDGGTLSANFEDLQGTGGSSISNVVYLTGDQNVSGVKNFSSRPTVNGTGVLLNGEASSNSFNGIAWNFISSLEVSDDSSVSINLTGYNRYNLDFRNLSFQYDGYPLLMRVSFDTGSTFLTSSSYSYGIGYINSWYPIATTSTEARIVPSLGSTVSGGLFGQLTCESTGGSSNGARFHYILSHEVWNSDQIALYGGAVKVNIPSGVNAVQFYASYGNLKSGIINLYGSNY